MGFNSAFKGLMLFQYSPPHCYTSTAYLVYIVSPARNYTATHTVYRCRQAVTQPTKSAGLQLSVVIVSFPTRLPVTLTRYST